MELLTVLKEMNHTNTILWKGLNIRLLIKYLEDNNIGKIYEPVGDYFEDVVQNILDELEVLTSQRINLIVNAQNILKYPIKSGGYDNSSCDMIIKAQILSEIDYDANLICINEIKDIDIPTNIKTMSFLNANERLYGGISLIWKSKCIIRMDERNSDKEIDVVLVKHTNSDNINTKWTLNKDFKEVKKSPVKLANVLKKNNSWKSILWKNNNYDLLKIFLSKNDIGNIYEPVGDYFEDVVMHILIFTIYASDCPIVNIDNLLKYDLKANVNYDNNVTKLRIINEMFNNLEIVWITSIYDAEFSIIHKSKSVIKIDERDDVFDIVLIKDVIPDNIGTKWTLNKDFEEVK